MDIDIIISKLIKVGRQNVWLGKDYSVADLIKDLEALKKTKKNVRKKIS